MLDSGAHLSGDNTPPARETIDEAVEVGRASAQLLTRAAGLLIALGDTQAAHRLLEQASGIDGAPAPTQLALARSFARQGDTDSASRWLRGALLRARPDGALLLELATLEWRNALAIALAARAFTCRDAQLAASSGQLLLAQGEMKAARIAFDMAFGAGERSADFLMAYSELLADPSLHKEPSLPPGPLGMPHWWNVATLAVQARLSAAFPREDLLTTARQREASARWIGSDRLTGLLAERIRARDPFSWIRLGDGEARFLLHLHPELGPDIPRREAAATARQIWHVWFGQDIDAVPADALAALGGRFEQAIRNADLLGVASAKRLEQDTLHYGFCALLEKHVSALFGEGQDGLLTDAGLHTILNESEPFFSSLLGGLDFLGVVSPHPQLAERLQRQHGIGNVRTYDIPGETRLDRPREHADRGTHFPAVYQRMMADLTVPHRGAVFLVAGGLLGKIYCDRIKQLGGIALDIGALADAWMGYNSRGSALNASMRWQLPA